MTGDPLRAEQAAAVAAIEALTREFDAVVAASRASNADDEHDPEGATIAFERAQVDHLLRQARRSRDELEVALRRLAEGTYGTCASCGRPIAASRLEARPGATLCIDCAR